ncbi:MAG: hypothetical protein IPG60_07345 [Bacteroidetes bacterium]|nr:hypothetical protein [Bacteroidota bacterium]
MKRKRYQTTVIKSPFNAENNQSFLWKRWDELQEKDLNFPIDKEILRRIKFGEIQI